MTSTPARSGRPLRFSRPEERRQLLAALTAWQDQTGSADPPERALIELPGRERPYPVGMRLRTARSNYRDGKLPAQFISELEAIPGFAWQPRQPDSWQERFLALTSYAEQHGSLEGLSSRQPALWRWLRKQARQGSQLPAEQRRALQQLRGMSLFTTSRPRSAAATLAAALRVWLAESGARDVTIAPYSATVELDGQHVPIGPRSAYIRDRYSQGRLTEEDIGTLEALPGWTWAKPSQQNERHPHFAKILTHARAARTWMAQTGSPSIAAMPSSATVTLDGQPINVGQALKNYRARHRAGKLTPAAITVLEQLPGYSPDPRRPGRKES